MKHNRLRRLAAQFTVIGALAFAVAGIVAGRAAAQGPAGLPLGQTSLTSTPDIRFDQRVNNQVPLDLAFRDETGKIVHLRDYFHDRKPVILIMPFFKCMSGCTLEMKGLATVCNQMNYKVGDDFEIVTISINPKEGPDIATKQKAVYLQMYTRPGGQAGWHFLTGLPDVKQGQENIQALARSIGFKYVFNLETEQFGHATGIVVLTPEGKAYRYFYGADYSPREVRMALNEASNNKLGTVVDQLLQLCFHYDPTTGHYGLLIRRVMIFAGVMTVLILATSIMLMLRWERKNMPHGPTPPAGGLPPSNNFGMQSDTQNRA